MGRLTASQVAIEAAEARLTIVYGGEVKRALTWNESMQMGICKVELEGSASYYLVTMSDQAGAVEDELLDELEEELGQPLADCVVESKRVDRPHPEHRGSTWFYSVTLASY